MTVHHAENIAKKDAFNVCLEKIQDHNLETKLMRGIYLDNNKVLFYFTADGRVDLEN